MTKERNPLQQESYPSREKLQGKLLDYLMNLAKKHHAGQSVEKIKKFDPEVSSSFLEFVRTHPENTRFPSDEVYFYLLEIYQNDDDDILGLEFLSIENAEYRLNDRLVRIYEKEKKDYENKNPELSEDKREDDMTHIRAQRLHSKLQSKMQEKVKLPSFNVSDLI